MKWSKQLNRCVLSLLVVHFPNDVPFDSEESAVGCASYSKGIHCNWHHFISRTTYGTKSLCTVLHLCLLVSNYFVFHLFP